MILGDDAIKVTVDFITNFINNEHWQDIAASLCAFSCLLYGISPLQAHDLLVNSFNNTMSLFNHQNGLIRACAIN